MQERPWNSKSNEHRHDIRPKFEWLYKMYKDGNELAAYEVMRICRNRNLPPPAWAVDIAVQVMDLVYLRRKSVSWSRKTGQGAKVYSTG